MTNEELKNLVLDLESRVNTLQKEFNQLLGLTYRQQVRIKNGLAGSKVYYVSDTTGGATTRRLTFKDGILTLEISSPSSSLSPSLSPSKSPSLSPSISPSASPS